MRVLVTGAGGYVGHAVVDSLILAGHDPIAMIHSDGHRVPEGVEVRFADLRDPIAVSGAATGVEAVCHLAGLTRARESWDRPLDYFAVNVGGTGELLRAMDNAGIGQLVFASTGAVYGTPEQQPMSEELPAAPPHPYASSKVAAEALLGWESRRRGMTVSALRLFNTAGRHDPDQTRIVPRVLAATAGQSDPLGINGDGSVVRDYLHVDDAAEAFVAALEHPPHAPGIRCYNIGSGVGASISDVIAATERVTGMQVPVIHNPPAYEPLVLVCDRSRAANELAWQPRRSGLDTILRDAWTALTGGRT